VNRTTDRGKMDSTKYIAALRLLPDHWESDSGDQSLLIPDILACFKDCGTIALPYACPTLENYLHRAGYVTSSNIHQHCDGVYWGTPTIVGGHVLFPKSVEAGDDEKAWDVPTERKVTRFYTSAAIQAGIKVIVTGLGSGDITPEQRLADMGGGQIVSYKVFGDFQDWVLCRWINGYEI